MFGRRRDVFALHVPREDTILFKQDQRVLTICKRDVQRQRRAILRDGRSGALEASRSPCLGRFGSRLANEGDLLWRVLEILRAQDFSASAAPRSGGVGGARFAPRGPALSPRARAAAAGAGRKPRSSTTVTSSGDDVGMSSPPQRLLVAFFAVFFRSDGRFFVAGFFLAAGFFFFAEGFFVAAPSPSRSFFGYSFAMKS